MIDPGITSDLPVDAPKEKTPERIEWEQRLAIDREETELRHKTAIGRLNDKNYSVGYQNFLAYDDNMNPLGFRPAKVAEFLKENENFKTDVKTGVLYYFDGRCWIPNAEPYLQVMVAKLLGEENRKTHYVNIKHHLLSITKEAIAFSKKIAVENGLLDPETGELTQPTPKEMTCYSIPVKYDPHAAKLDNWLEFLKQVAILEDIPLLQEWFGYCLLPDYRFHKALWIHGEGRNGKGVFDRTIQGILGKNNVSTVGLEEMDGEHRFVLCQLNGRLYNSCSEPTTNRVFKTEIFQKITGADTIKAELKGSNDRIEFVNQAKITIIGNRFPRIDNPTTAFKDRMMFVKFPNFFSDQDRIVNLENIWLSDPEQRSSILNWALEGLHRLLSQGYFTQTKTQRETEIEFNRVSNSTGAFIMEMGILCKTLTTTRNQVLTAYQEYCEDIGVEPKKSSVLTQAMQRLGPKVKDGWIYKPKKERAWIGFGLKDAAQQNMEQMEHLEQQKTLITMCQESQNNYLEKKGVPSVLSVPTWYVKEIPQGPKCECGVLNVTLELTTPTKDVIKRCTRCYEKLKNEFPNAIWKPAYQELPSFERGND